MIYLDPTSPQAQGLDPGTPGHGGVITLPDEKAADVARRLQRAGDDPAAIRDAVGGLLPQARLSALRRTDGRIGRAIGILERNLDRNLSLADVSSRLELSPGRFRHLFKKETGTTFSAFRLWTRVLAATRLLARNPDLTWASHEAAFSDSAHFSRSFHQTFGLRPSEIFKSGRFRLVFCD
jgi:AraC-like DNA-binding protein